MSPESRSGVDPVRPNETTNRLFLGTHPWMIERPVHHWPDFFIILVSSLPTALSDSGKSAPGRQCHRCPKAASSRIKGPCEAGDATPGRAWSCILATRLRLDTTNGGRARSTAVIRWKRTVRSDWRIDFARHADPVRRSIYPTGGHSRPRAREHLLRQDGATCAGGAQCCSAISRRLVPKYPGITLSCWRWRAAVIIPP